MEAQPSASGPLDLPSEREGFPAPPDLIAQRQGLAAAVSSGIWRTDTPATSEDFGGVRCLSFTPPAPRGTVFHLHGGGFRLGCPEQIGPFASALAARCQVRVICPAYRLAPEFPFPAGLIDAWSAITGVLDAGEQRLVISGDSAGGALAAGLAAIVGSTSFRPLGLTLLSPWLDLAVTAPSFAANAVTDALFSESSARSAAALYLQGISTEHPLASPLHGSLECFPPTLINAGTGEVLADDARRMADRLRACGIPAQLHLVEGMGHVAVTRNPALRGSAETFAVLTAFIDGLLDPPI